MRPVNKGTSPYTPIQEYRDALPYLESRIGIYCSYCGAIIDHAPEIEQWFPSLRAEIRLSGKISC